MTQRKSPLLFRGRLVRVAALFQPSTYGKNARRYQDLRYAGRHAKQCAAARCPYLEAAATAVNAASLSLTVGFPPLALFVCSLLQPRSSRPRARSTCTAQTRRLRRPCATPLSRRCVRNSPHAVFIISCSSITPGTSLARAPLVLGRSSYRPLSLVVRSQYNGVWHCFVGRNFGAYMTHEANHHVYFYFGQMAVLLFKTG